jgi:glutathione synthase/RimK-type ligase-like ATP-grasp enzyme
VKIALATAIGAFPVDEDLAPLQQAFAELGASAEPLAWDDPTVSWGRFDAVLLRSTWDYCERREAFLDWCAGVEARSRLYNPLATVRWNSDKHYLADLEAAGVPIVPSRFLVPGDDPQSLPEHAGLVVKPSVGADGRDAAGYGPGQRAQALAHVQRLLDAGRGVLLQPYIEGIERRGETSLVLIDGRDSHAIRKGPLLHPDAAAGDQRAAEPIRPRVASEAEHALAAAALAAVPGPPPLYARVDLLPGDDGPLLLELELIEPSLFFAAGRGAADRLAAALLRRVRGGT